MSVSEQIPVRHRYTQDVIAYFSARPGIWIEAVELARIGGFCAWRTRVSEARKSFTAKGGSIEWNGKTKGSAYRYRPFQALGRDAAEEAPAPWNQVRPFAEPFTLKP